MCRSQRGLDEIKKVTADHNILADLWARQIVKLEEKESRDAVDEKSIHVNRPRFKDMKEAIADLEALYKEVAKD